MTRYTDPLDPMLNRERDLLIEIGKAMARERGQPVQDWEEAARDAIAQWTETGEEEADLRALRPLSDLQKLLIEHDQLQALIAEELERRLG